MRRDKVGIICVGSSKITAMIASRALNGDIVTYACVDKYYGGFSEGEFFDGNEFEDTVRSALKEAQAAAKCKVKKVFVGVPNAFLLFRTKKVIINFVGRKKIKQKDIAALLKSGEAEVKQGGYEIISRLPIAFGINGKKVFNPIGFYSAELGGYISYVMASAPFIDDVKRAVGAKGIKTEFVSEGFITGEYFFKDQMTSYPILVADIGYITSSFSIIYGGGVVAAASVDAGGGFITAALMDKYSLSIETAEELKRKINLGLKESPNSYYKLQTDTGVLELSVAEVNTLSKEVIDDAVGALDDFIEKNSAKFQGEIKVYLTGGGIARIRGAKSHVSSRIGIEAELLSPGIPEYDKPERSALIAIANYATGGR